MHPGEATLKIRSTFRVTVLVGVLLGVSVIANAVMAAAIAGNQRDVVLVPTLTGELQVRAGTPTHEYLELVTRDVASAFLNRTPHNTSYFRERVLRLAHESVIADLEITLRADEANAIETRTTTVFHPSQIYVRPDENYSEIIGRHQTFVGNELVDEATRIYAAHWRVEGVSVKLLDFVEIDNRDSRAVAMRE